ncbi:MAG: hypothetical protein ACPGJH_08665, partial [Alphaproteobacteria bacterium]
MSDEGQKTPAKPEGRKTLSLRPGAGSAGARSGSRANGGAQVVVQKKRKRVVAQGDTQQSRTAQKTYPGGLTKEEWEARQ